MKKYVGPPIPAPTTDPNKERIERMNTTIGLNNIQLDVSPTLVISKRMDLYIRHLHNTYPTKEWLGICKVIQDPQTKYFHLVDMIHPEQTASAGECEATDEGMMSLTKWIQENDPDSLHQRPLTLHSHHKMGVFWSQTDDQARLKQNDGRPYSMAVVTAYDMNRPTEIQYKGCINFFKPYNMEFDFTIIVEDDQDLLQAQEDYQAQKDFAYDQAKEDALLQEDTDHDFQLVTSMLGKNILPQLEANQSSILHKMVKKDIDTRYSSLLQHIEKPQLLQDLDAWIENRATMLKKAIKKTPTYGGITSYSLEDFVYYTSSRFKNQEEIEQHSGVKLPRKAFISNGVWCIFHNKAKLTVDDYVDRLLNYTL